MAATNKMICHDHATQGHHRTGNTSGAPAEQTVEVYAPDTKTLYQVPTSGISHLGCQDSNASTPTPGRARHLICRSYCNAIEEGQRPSEVTACAMGKQCRFVHVDIPLSKVKGDVIHVHYVYRDEALCGYERLSTAMTRDHPEISADQASSMMLMIYGPNNREPVERIPPSRLLLTGGSRYALECTVNPRRTNHGLPEQPRVCHCAHYYFTQTCNRGANCSFIHVVSVDATQKADSSKPANYRRRVTQLGQVEVPQMGMGTPQVGYHSSTMNTPATAQHTNGQNHRSVPSSPHQQHQTSPNVHNTNAPTPSAINPYPASQRRNNNSRGHNATDASVSMMNDSMQGTPATRRAVPAAISTDSCNNSHTNYQPRNNARPNNGGSPTLTANHHKANNSSTSGMVNSTTLLPLTTTDGHATSVGSVVNFAMPVNANVCPPPPLQATVGSQRSTPAMAAHGRVPYPIVGNGSVPPPPPVAFGDDTYVQVGRAAPTSAGQRGTNNMLPMDDVDGDEGYGYDGHEECGAAYAPPIQTGNNNNSQHCGYSSTGSPHINQHYSTTSFGGRGGMGMDIGCLYQSPNQQAYSSHNTADADRATYSTSTGSYYNNQSEQQFNLQKNGGSVEGSYFSNYASPSSPATNAAEHRQYANSNRASPAGTPGTAMHRSLGTPKVVAAGRFAHNPYAQSPVTAAHNPYAQSPVTVQAQV